MPELKPPPPDQVESDVRRALAEDFGSGDVTADLIDPDAHAHARIVCREEAVIAGIPWAQACFRALDPDVRIEWACGDGDRLAADAVLCGIEGKARALVGAERCSLNFLQTLSATATVTRAYADAVAGTRATILDTRKTLPGLRIAQKYAVRCGGGQNHRLDLSDGILVKNNHIELAGGITRALDNLHQNRRGTQPIEVEVRSLKELEEALQHGAEAILLDNMPVEDVRKAVERCAKFERRIPLEASGGINLQNVRSYAETGVDYISVGALTHSPTAVDMSLRISPA